MSNVRYDILRAFGGRWRAIVYLNYRQVAMETFDTYDEALAWANDEVFSRS